MLRDRDCPVLHEIAHQERFISEVSLGCDRLRAITTGNVVLPGRELAGLPYFVHQVPDDSIGNVLTEEGLFHLLQTCYECIVHSGAGATV